jgi:hypothetical protein
MRAAQSSKKKTEEEFDSQDAGHFWAGKLQEDAVNDLFSCLFGAVDSVKEQPERPEQQPEAAAAVKVDEIVKRMPAEHVTEVWDTGGIPTYWLAALWGMGGKWVKKQEEKAEIVPARCLEPEPEPADCAQSRAARPLRCLLLCLPHRRVLSRLVHLPLPL